jgi:glycosyltransferase involved in cell wall biosynthesis
VRRVVLIAYYYPPMGGAASQRVLGFARHLPAHGWAPTVVAPVEGTFGRDASLPLSLDPPGRVIRCLSPEPATLLKRCAGRAGSSLGDGGLVREVDLGRGASRLRGFVREWVYVPDAQAPWIPFATLAAIRASRGASAVVSSGPPLSAHVAGWLASRATGLPWVADVRDLWTPRRMHPETARARLDAKILRGLLRRANAIVTVSGAFVDLLSRTIDRPASDITVLPNGFDPEDYDAADREPPDRFTLTFTGLTYGLRQDLDVFFRTLLELFAAGRIERTRFCLRILGRLDERTQALVRERGLTDVVVDEGFRPHRESTAAQRDATALLLLIWSADDDIAPGVRPAKLPEYIGAGRPVLALGDPGCEAARLIADAGAGQTLRFDDGPAIAEALTDLYATWEQNGDLPRTSSAQGAAPHTRHEGARILAGVLAR